jgi:hypothetical protein
MMSVVPAALGEKVRLRSNSKDDRSIVSAYCIAGQTRQYKGGVVELEDRSRGLHLRALKLTAG